MTDADIITAVMMREGGFVDDVSDPGGPTHWGVTQATLTAWRGHPVTVSDVASLSEDEARQILTSRYVTGPGFDKIKDTNLRAEVVDAGVNHGSARVIRWLQKVVEVTQDGVLGTTTVVGINAAGPSSVRAKLIAARARYYGEIISANPTQAKFAAGWMNRLAGFIEQLT